MDRADAQEGQSPPRREVSLREGVVESAAGASFFGSFWRYGCDEAGEVAPLPFASSVAALSKAHRGEVPHPSVSGFFEAWASLVRASAEDAAALFAQPPRHL